MDWSNERYVRVYTRDTTAWLCWSWQAQAVWLVLLRKVDRAGVLSLDGYGDRGLLAHTRLPWEVVEPGLAELLADGCLERHGEYLLIRNFQEAQDAAQSDRARQEASRERRRDMARRESIVTNRDDGSLNVTECHVQSQSVTPDQPSLSGSERSCEAGASRQLALSTPAPGDESPRGAARAMTETVLAYLNRKASRRYTASAPHVDLIRARMGEGYGLEDFRAVVDSKVGEWLGDEKMSRCLRPDTLFCRKHFATYRDEARTPRANGAAGSMHPVNDVTAARLARERAAAKERGDA